MVNATIDNNPVFVLISDSESTTVPANEVWKVSLHLANDPFTNMKINGVSTFQANFQREGSEANYLDVVLIGGTTIENTAGGGIMISGFIVKS